MGTLSFWVCEDIVCSYKGFWHSTVEDLLKKPVSWTAEFFDCGLGPGETYSWPRSIAQAKLRMEENLKRYMGNYLILIAIVFIIFLYVHPAHILFLSVNSVFEFSAPSSLIKLGGYPAFKQFRRSIFPLPLVTSMKWPSSHLPYFNLALPELALHGVSLFSFNK